ncbi:hypothetical protein BGZ72_000532 [Mortierella alpina]|nr:hypothetical protein BGZ72_000532 [Mortierella alpina]
MDEDQILKRGHQPLLSEIRDLLRTFHVSDGYFGRFQGNAKKSRTPHFDRMNSTSFIDKHSLSTTLAYFNKLGLETIVSLGTFVDVENPQKWILKLDSGGVGMPSSDPYFMDDEKAAYIGLISKMFSLILRDDNDDSVENTPQAWIEAAKAAFLFERNLVAILTAPDVQGEEASDYTSLSVRSLRAVVPSVDWPLLFERTLPAGVNGSRPVYVSSQSFLLNLEALLEETSPQILQSYFVWTAIRQLATYLAPTYSDPLLHQVGARSERWKYCVGITSAGFGDSIRPYLAEKILEQSSRSITQSMVKSVQSVIKGNLNRSTWFDCPMTTAALNKMNTMVVLVGIPDNHPLVDPEEALNSYKNCRVNSSDFFENQLRLSACRTETSFKKLDTAIDRISPTKPPYAVNIYFDQTQNKIEIPVGILQPPFFHSDYPEYINYGSIGAMLSHKLTHGFDDRGRHFDASGRKIEWWSDCVADAYKNRSRCFIDQYNEFGLNGFLTLEENIADSGGLKFAFRAWKERYDAEMEGNGGRSSNYKLMGLETYSPEQLFFLTYGNSLLWLKFYLMRLMFDTTSTFRYTIRFRKSRRWSEESRETPISDVLFRTMGANANQVLTG